MTWKRALATSPRSSEALAPDRKDPSIAEKATAGAFSSTAVMVPPPDSGPTLETIKFTTFDETRPATKTTNATTVVRTFAQKECTFTHSGGPGSRRLSGYECD